MTRTALLLLLLAPAAQAATFSVTRQDDPPPDGCVAADCSLREAVLAANATPGPDTVLLGAGIHSLTRIDTTPATREDDTGPLRVDESLLVQGVASSRTQVRWNTTSKFSNPVFQTDAATPTLVALHLKALSVSHGRGSQGGCIHMSDPYLAGAHHLTLDDVRVHECRGTSGGAAYLYGTDLTLSDAQLHDNAATDGGALYLLGSAQIVSAGSSLHDNTAKRHGGAVSIYGMGIIGLISEITWIDDGSSTIESNSAGANGGGIHLWHTATLDLASLPGRQMLTIAGNQAQAQGGGVSLKDGASLVPGSSSIERVRILDNTAASGGGLHSDISLHLRDSEIARNIANTGVGGGIAFAGSINWPAGRSIERVSLHANAAALGGGAISSECSPFEMIDSAMFTNAAAPGAAQALQATGNATLRHVTLSDHDDASGPAIDRPFDAACGSTQLTYANSLIDGACASAVGSQLLSLGGNQLGASATACPDLTGLDQRQTVPGVFALDFALFDSPFDVPGWDVDGIVRPQQDFGLATHCSAFDIRGVARTDGACDAGAFERD